jgi:hypothetical protein
MKLAKLNKNELVFVCKKLLKNNMKGGGDVEDAYIKYLIDKQFLFKKHIIDMYINPISFDEEGTSVMVHGISNTIYTLKTNDLVGQIIYSKQFNKNIKYIFKNDEIIDKLHYPLDPTNPSTNPYDYQQNVSFFQKLDYIQSLYFEKLINSAIEQIQDGDSRHDLENINEIFKKHKK